MALDTKMRENAIDGNIQNPSTGPKPEAEKRAWVVC
jgi:hypothetical protein